MQGRGTPPRALAFLAMHSSRARLSKSSTCLESLVCQQPVIPLLLSCCQTLQASSSFTEHHHMPTSAEETATMAIVVGERDEAPLIG
jgi:hypothetical protein